MTAGLLARGSSTVPPLPGAARQSVFGAISLHTVAGAAGDFHPVPLHRRYFGVRPCPAPVKARWRPCLSRERPGLTPRSTRSLARAAGPCSAAFRKDARLSIRTRVRVPVAVRRLSTAADTQVITDFRPGRLGRVFAGGPEGL